MPAGRHIVFATVGSLGDLFPFLAVGQALAARGHRVTVATHPVHREPIERAGLVFADASGMPEPDDREAFTAKAFHPWRGPAFVVRDFAAADVRASYAKLAPLCDTVDVLVTSTLAFAGQILGETLEAAGRLRWLSAVLAPASFLSAYDMPATGLAALDRLFHATPARGRLLQRLSRRVTRGWTAPVRAFRRELGLSPESPRGDPFHRGQFAPGGTLALFPALLGAPQPDWPPHATQCGFARYVQPHTLDPALAEFLRAGPPPIVFSLGSTAVHANASFLHESLAAAVALGCRAVLFTGSPAMRERLPRELPEGIACVEYAPHAAVFPQAAAVVHHGGVGTSAEALHAGVPSLVVPHGFDQHDNAARLQRLGVAGVLAATRYRRDAAAAGLGGLLDPAHASRARTVAGWLKEADGAAAAADVIEHVGSSG
ncbi:glycosyltransferase [Dyella lutea]|uniref:Glycosyltransferase n=1 Tax=Dyella lutea TaxID=2950441 RepID=A0ABT1F642_9GAMM|nr:glycosyltransferase [Dyella lutea]MCP1372846.1 glycosyltransferase [Dyella lutea]